MGDRSPLGRALSDASETSRIAAALRDWPRTSAIGRATTRAVGFGAGVVRSASVVRTARGIPRWAKASFIYRWLTEEPEPEVIVIDLRETLTVGPVIAALDRGLAALLPAVARSEIARLASETERYVRRAPIRALGVVVFAATAVDLLVSMATAVTLAGFVLRLVVLVFAAVGTRVTMTWDELLRTRPVRLAVAALEPPEPEEWEDRDTVNDEGKR